MSKVLLHHNVCTTDHTIIRATIMRIAIPAITILLWRSGSDPTDIYPIAEASAEIIMTNGIFKRYSREIEACLKEFLEHSLADRIPISCSALVRSAITHAQ